MIIGVYNIEFFWILKIICYVGKSGLNIFYIMWNLYGFYIIFKEKDIV